MSSKLEELRKRFLQQQGESNGGPRDAAGAKSGGAASDESEPLFIVKRAVAPSKIIAGANPAETPSGEPSVAEPAPSAIATSDSAPAGDAKSAAEREDAAMAEAGMARTGTAPAVSSGFQRDAAIGTGELGAAVARVFEQTRSMRATLAEFSRAFEHLERLGQSAAQAFEPLRRFQGQIEQLAKSFAPMRGLRLELAGMSETFAPMRELQNQVERLAAAFEENLGEVVVALEPARQIRQRLERLAQAFRDASELRDRFADLRSNFAIGDGDGRNDAARSR